MRFALCGFYVWKDFFVQVPTVFIFFSLEGGDAIRVPFSTSSLNPDFAGGKFWQEVQPQKREEKEP
jgi:hypothetical protein